MPRRDRESKENCKHTNTRGKRGGAKRDPRACHKGNNCPRKDTCRFQHPVEPRATLHSPMRQLGSLWQFPSDHLPVGAVLEDGTLMISWNVMDSALVQAVHAMGLEGSMITQQNVAAGSGSLTWRDATVLQTVLTWMTPCQNPVGVLALQECSRDFLAVLDAKLTYTPYARADESTHGDAVMIYHKGLLRLTNFTMHEQQKSPFTGRHGGSGKPLAVATFERTSGPLVGAAGMLRVVAGKIPGNPSGIHLREYAEFLQQLFSRVSMRTILMGDFNFLESEVLNALQACGLVQWDGVVPPSAGRYPTNIQPKVQGLPPGFGGGPLAPKRIDHVLQLGGGLTGMVHHCGILCPDQVLSGLQRVIDCILTGQPSAVLPQSFIPIWERVMTPDQCLAFFRDSGDANHVEPAEPLTPTTQSVAARANVTKDVARVALTRPEVQFSQSREMAAVEWLLQQDLQHVAELRNTDTSPLTSPGPFRRSPFSSPWPTPDGSPMASPGASSQSNSPMTSPETSPSLRPSRLNTKRSNGVTPRKFALDIVTPTNDSSVSNGPPVSPHVLLPKPSGVSNMQDYSLEIVSPQVKHSPARTMTVPVNREETMAKNIVTVPVSQPSPVNQVSASWPGSQPYVNTNASHNVIKFGNVPTPSPGSCRVLTPSSFSPPLKHTLK